MPYRLANDLEKRHFEELVAKYKGDGEGVRANSQKGLDFMRRFEADLDRFGYVPKSNKMLLVRIDPDPVTDNGPEAQEFFAAVARMEIGKIMTMTQNRANDAP